MDTYSVKEIADMLNTNPKPSEDGFVQVSLKQFRNQEKAEM